jgi:dTDP-4-amino-4,6-dideoxygalactose transaminase
MIFYNRPFITGKEFEYINDAIANRHLSGNGPFTAKCQNLLQQMYQLRKALLTTSCTDALEMGALLLSINAGDEIIMPSFTFVSTANAFMLQGAKIVLADSEPLNPNIDATQLEPLITTNTKAIVVVHYAGVACNMLPIMALAKKYKIAIVEDAAQSIDAYFVNNGCQIPLSTIGNLAAVSFHESKNIHCGEGGMLVVNDEKFIDRAEIIWEKGTNRASFFRGEVDKYNWVDVGSSFLPSEITAAFLYAQLQHINSIQATRMALWNRYYELLLPLQKEKKILLPNVPEYAIHNAHIFYIVCANEKQRSALISYLNKNKVQAMFHYPGLHTSQYFIAKFGQERSLPNATRFSHGLLRLPLFPQLSFNEVEFVCEHIFKFFELNERI